MCHVHLAKTVKVLSTKVYSSMVLCGGMVNVFMEIVCNYIPS